MIEESESSEAKKRYEIGNVTNSTVQQGDENWMQQIHR
jgi:hypothetical protein